MPAEELLRTCAQVAIEVGLGVEPGDRVMISAPVQLPEFGRMLVEAAYDAGAVTADMLWFDDGVERARFTHGGDESASAISGFSQFLRCSHDSGASGLRVLAEDPAALAGADPQRVQRHRRVNGEYLHPVMQARGDLKVPWAVIGAPIPAWSRSVFGDLDPEEATERLWDAVLRACRIDTPDPIAAWRAHSQELNDRAAHLSSLPIRSVRYAGPGTDLVLGMTDHGTWKGGGVRTPAGKPFVPNIPTEEVFTSPHRMKAEGTVRASKPLSYFGELIEDFSFELSEGRVVSWNAGHGGEVLERVLDTDDGSVRFGEAAMVPMSGAVATEGLVWNNMLYD